MWLQKQRLYQNLDNQHNMKKQFMNEFIMHSGNEIMKQQQTQVGGIPPPYVIFNLCHPQKLAKIGFKLQENTK